MAIQIGKYKRPGVYTEEIDNSTIPTQTVTGITNLVIGSSKKGPVNKPVLLTNPNDVDAVYGSLDRDLERKGSFFHRTLTKMLESSPIWGINLLATNDTLDRLEYKSISTSAVVKNDAERTAPYRKFFDTTGFWERDTLSFLNQVKDNPGASNRVLHFTNFSEKAITVFVFKSALTGFDVPLGQWYPANQLPPYVDGRDYASDYMIDVVVVSGDWTNYADLSVNPTWAKYFSTEGLRKTMLSSFTSDSQVQVLKYYEGLSLIPYFNDRTGKDIFVQSVVNNDTDKVGLFCAFNTDLFETDKPNGLVDLLGSSLSSPDSLVDLGVNDIEFLSYKETILEQLSYGNVVLDRAGNALGMCSGASGLNFRASLHGGVNRTGYYTDGYVSGLSQNAPTNNTSSITISYTAATDSYLVMSGVSTSLSTTTISIPVSQYPSSGITMSYISAIVADTTGVIKKIDNLVGSSTGTPLAPAVSTTDTVLGFVTSTVHGGEYTAPPTIVPITVDVNGFFDLVYGDDYNITDLGSGSIKVEFLGTAASPSTANYYQYRVIRAFNKIVAALSSANLYKMSLLVDAVTMEKASLANATITNIVTSTTANKSFVLNTGLAPEKLTNVLLGCLLLYVVDDEFVKGTHGVVTRNTKASSTDTSIVDAVNLGVVAKYSKFYSDYVDGNINTGDFFYTNLLAPNTNVSVTFDTYLGNSYVKFDTTGSVTGFPNTINGDETFIVSGSTLNRGTITIIDSANFSGDFPGYEFVYKVAEAVVDEVVVNVTKIWDASNKIYLKAILNSDDTLGGYFTDSTLSSPVSVDSTQNPIISIYSEKSNFKQTIEIETVAGYTPVPNKILVKGSRYTEVKIGDFLEADVDLTALEIGEVPRKYTRILSKRAYAADATYAEITCDAAISKITVSGEQQTMRFISIENYVNTYKGVALTGFKLRKDSLPDGTEARQKAVLNLVAKGTPLFKAITNKDAFDFRYLIDSFGLGLTENSKQQLVDICGTRLDCFGVLNMPSMKQMRESSSPSFVDADGVLSTSYIATGGNPESNPAFLYSFGEGAGSTCVGYFMPYVNVNDNGRPASVPPAAYIATTYMRKQNSNSTNITPWTIAAGISQGRVTGIGSLEVDFNNEDIENLNLAQMNMIVYKKNRGYCVQTENTAQTLYKSALSYIHVREVLIELERRLAAMLLDFQGKFNTSDRRAEIVYRANQICREFVAKEGLYNFFNKSDDENNTSEVIDNQIGVLDTYVEPIKGMMVVVNRITILKTGAISAGFTAA
jgi:hypothetical protein